MSNSHKKSKPTSKNPSFRLKNASGIRKFKILSKKEGKIFLEADEKFFLSMVQMMTQVSQDFADNLDSEEIHEDIDKQPLQEEEQSCSSQSDEKSKTPQQQAQQAQDGVKGTQDFYRRIPHFFMGRFKKWAKILRETEVCEFLNKLRSNKKSKQGRYELGDFHKCFQIDKNDVPDVQKTKKKIKELFLEFLQNEAILQIIQYNKINNQDQKRKYIDVIPNMVQEMYSDKPFDQFLAQSNIEKQIKKKNQLINDQSNSLKQEEAPKLDLFRGESFKSNFDH